ncbi:hypothetical protein DL96DRAFT_1607725 [Flagelloscypha sp. PMI_526]|nr:hypothetical protein DL96DRAFT_1607725 [Flagelloscypha sp. PMI_526]
MLHSLTIRAAFGRPRPPPQIIRKKTQVTVSPSISTPKADETFAEPAQNISAEVWMRIAWFLEDEDLSRLWSLNRAFLTIALDIRYAVWHVAGSKAICDEEQDLYEVVSKTAVSFRSPSAIQRCHTVIMTPSFENHLVKPSHSSIFWNRFSRNHVEASKLRDKLIVEIMEGILALTNVTALQILPIPPVLPWSTPLRSKYLDTCWQRFGQQLTHVILTVIDIYHLAAYLPPPGGEGFHQLDTLDFRIVSAPGSSLGKEPPSLVQGTLRRFGAFISQCHNLTTFLFQEFQSHPRVDLTEALESLSPADLPYLKDVTLFGFDRREHGKNPQKDQRRNVQKFLHAFGPQLDILSVRTRIFRFMSSCKKLKCLDLALFPEARLSALALSSVAPTLVELRLRLAGTELMFGLPDALSSAKNLRVLVTELPLLTAHFFVELALEVPELEKLEVQPQNIFNPSRPLHDNPLVTSLTAPIPHTFTSTLQKHADILSVWKLRDLIIRSQVTDYLPIYGLMQHVSNYVPSIVTFGNVATTMVPSQGMYYDEQKVARGRNSARSVLDSCYHCHGTVCGGRRSYI